MNHKYFLFLTALLLILTPVFAKTSSLIFFYQPGCHACSLAEPIIEELEQDYDLIVDMRDIHDTGNIQLLYSYADAYGIDSSTLGTPTIFLNNISYIGYSEELKQILIDEIVRCDSELSINCECIFNNELAQELGAELFPETGEDCNQTHNVVDFDLTIPAILSAAVVDSINPCAFAVMIFLLTYLLNIGSKKRLMKVGFAYIISVYVVYFLAGLGLLSAIQSIQISSIIYWIGASFAIIAGLINIKDSFYKKRATLAISEKAKPLIQKWTKKATVPAAIILGLLVSAFELPCTGGVYLAILGLMSTSVSTTTALIYLAIYNFIFVLPLIIILLLVSYGTKAEKLEKWRNENRNIMRLVGGIFMLILGIWMVINTL